MKYEINVRGFDRSRDLSPIATNDARNVFVEFKHYSMTQVIELTPEGAINLFRKLEDFLNQQPDDYSAAESRK